MSYYNVPDAAYRNIPAGAPGWQLSPVPGWGMNTARAGGPRVGMGAFESTLPRFTRLAGPPEEAANKLVAYSSIAAGAGLLTGLLLMYMAFESGYLKASR